MQETTGNSDQHFINIIGKKNKMKSMTGYAYRESTKEDITVSVEIKSYNNRFLDISIHLAPWLSELEMDIRNFLCQDISRGKVDVTIRIRDKNIPVSVTINENAALSYLNSIRELTNNLGIKEKCDLNTLLGFEGIVETERNVNVEKYAEVLRPVLADAAGALQAERLREGNHTALDILSNVAVLEKSVSMISSHVPEIENSIKENLRERFSELLGDKIDENRILSETAVLLMKYTISEELSRLNAHLKEFRAEAERNPCPGKKLDFLSQEINREINTIGSKTPMLEVSMAVVEMKNALENIREQLRNVE